jgi:EmrB/QacA subfamily drug resistance transporter
MNDTRKVYMVVLSVAFASFLARLNLYTVNISLPTLSRVFNVGTAEVSQIVTSYLLVITGSLILFGKLGDKLGFKRMFIAGYVAFMLGSLLCGISQGIYSLIASRLIQGLGSSMLLAASFAIIAQAVPHERLGWAFGINATANALGVAAGAPLGGIIAGYLSWRLIFLINIPLGIAAIFFASRYLPASAAPGQKGQRQEGGFDIPGAVLSFLALSALLHVMNSGDEKGWTSPVILVFAAASIVLFIIFVVWEKRCTEPLLDMAMLKKGGFVFALAGTTMGYMLLAGNAFLLPFYLELVKGLDSAKMGMLLLIYSLIYVFVSPFAGRLSDRTNPVMLCAIAMLSGAVNALVFAYTLRLSGLAPVVVFLVWLGFSYVFFLAPINGLAMGFAPKGKEGTASGLLNTALNLSMVFGTAIFEMIFSQSLSGGTHGGAGMTSSRVPLSTLLTGFSHTYSAGSLMCLAAMVFSLLVKKKPR